MQRVRREALGHHHGRDGVDRRKPLRAGEEILRHLPGGIELEALAEEERGAGGRDLFDAAAVAVVEEAREGIFRQRGVQIELVRTLTKTDSPGRRVVADVKERVLVS